MKTSRGKLRNITTEIEHTKNVQKDMYDFIYAYTGLSVEPQMLKKAAEYICQFLKLKIGKNWFIKEYVKEGNDFAIEIPDLEPKEIALFKQKMKQFGRKSNNQVF